MNPIEEKEQPEKIVFFDDNCVLCNKSVAFILKWERDKILKFSGISGSNFLKEKLGHSREMDTIILMEGERLYFKSTAVLHLSRYLRGIFPVFRVLLVIPVRLRDRIYDFIAKNRSRWFGRTETCTVLTSETKDRFLL